MVLKYIQPLEDFYWPNDNKKQCRRCFVRKAKSEFNRQSARPDGYFSWCRDCFREYRIELKARKDSGDFRRLTSRAAISKRDRTAIKWVHNVVKRFGRQRAADLVYRSLESAAKKDRPPMIALEIISLLVRVLKYSEEKEAEFEKNRPAASAMTDGEIAAELRRIARGHG